MRIVKIIVLSAMVAVGLSAQSGPGKQFVRPAAGQTPPYSPAIKAGGEVYVSGQLGTDAKGDLVPGDVTAQATQIFANIKDLLGKAGSSLDQVVTTRVILANAADFPALDAVYRQQFKGDPPARTTVIGGMVRSGALIEIQATAVPNGVQRTAVLPAGWMKPASPYSYGIKAGDTLYMSGLVSRSGKDNTQVAGDVPTQTKTIMGNAVEVLKAAGMTLGDTVTSQVMLRDIKNFAPMNEAYRPSWEKDRPTRVTFEDAPPGTFDVEITFTAIKGSSPREIIIPNRADGTPGTAGPNFSPAIKVGNRLFISGGTGNNASNEGDMKAQAGETLARFGPALKAAGFDYKDIVSSEVYVTDVQKFNEMNDGYRPVFPTDAPTRTTFGVSKLAGGNALVEIMVTAVK
jgi:2-iminobutanoate/2-iminopropanoate deaminase